MRIKESTETIVGNKKYNDKIESTMRQKANDRGAAPLDCIGSQEFLWGDTSDKGEDGLSLCDGRKASVCA